MKSVIQLKKELKKISSPEQAKISERFCKTGKGEYAEGEIFLGIKVPDQRKISSNYQNLSLKEIGRLLDSKIHEYRLTALFILIKKYEKADAQEKKKIFDFYLKQTKNINNWGLVDISAPKIVGDYLLDNPRDVLYKLAKSPPKAGPRRVGEKNLWEKRIAIIACFTFIKNNDFKDALKISKILIKDEHDLIHKAVGWMLREVGKRNQQIEEEFLKKHCKQMPRVMLRYSIEKFDEDKRKFYMKFSTGKL
ncbi:DNA alkylation repair protein [Candidatus Parcubacteria bacterium]|nr:DNA alkylation repair protein [Candidatus Parcubacteria bacterium]